MARKAHLALAYIFFCGANTLAQERIPKFTDYPARVIQTSRSVKVQIHSTPDTVCFRTMLRKAAREGQLFAGHYSLGYWGCGTCIRVGIVDLASGRTYVTPFEVGSPPTEGGVRVKPNSRLLVIHDNADRDWYFLWTGKHLLPIYNGRVERREPEREFLRCSEITRFR